MPRSLLAVTDISPGKPSTSAQQVALARAHLTWIGVLDDPWAETMLRSPWRELGMALRWPVLSRARRNAMFGYLAGRTRFYDLAICDALDRGATQAVIVGTGYDSRAWRLARAAVQFFELDHPATQADKKRRARPGGPIYVAADLAIPMIYARASSVRLCGRRNDRVRSRGVAHVSLRGSGARAPACALASLEGRTVRW